MKSCGGRGAANINFNGGLSESEGRTIVVHRDGTWTFYYRALMEAHLGRELTADEVIHHINGEPSDDRLENLQVLTRAEHLAIHRAEVFAARQVKLTDADVGDIRAFRDEYFAKHPLTTKGRPRERFPQGVVGRLADEYGVAKGTIIQILAGRTRNRAAA